MPSQLSEAGPQWSYAFSTCTLERTKIRGRSYGFVWVEHDSDIGSHGSWREVSGKASSDHSVVAVSVDDSAPSHSKSGVVHGVLDFENIGDSLAQVPSGAGEVFAVLDVQQGLVTLLSCSCSSKAGEDSFLVKSDWLSLVIILSFLGRLDFLCHSSLFL